VPDQGQPRLSRDEEPGADGLSRKHPEVEALRLRLAGQSRRDAFIVWPLSAVLLMGGVALLINALVVDSNNEAQAFMTGGRGNPIWPWVAAGCTALVLAGVIFLSGVLRKSGRQSQLDLADLEARTEETVRSARGSNDLDTLLEVNRLLLAQYHQLSTGQSRSAFRVAQTVMAAASTLLLFGCVLAVLASDTTTSVTVASLSGLASAVGGYVASTLLRSYQVSVRQAEMYFREPVVAGYLLAGERVARSLSGDFRQQALGRVVDGFMQAAIGMAQQPSGEPQQATTEA